jgi:hypothetical protein
MPTALADSRWQDLTRFGSAFPDTPPSHEEERQARWVRGLMLARYGEIAQDSAARRLGLP